MISALRLRRSGSHSNQIINMTYSKRKDITTVSKKTEYEKKLQIQLDEFSTEIDRLKARADKAEEPWHKQQVEMLQEKHRQAKQKLGELKESGDDAWEDMKEGISSAWDSVSEAIKSAANRF